MSTLRRLLSQLEMFGTLDTQLLLGLAGFAFQTQDNLTCRLGLFVKDGLGLSPKSHLFGVVTAFALRKIRGLAGLVLGDLVDGVLVAFAGTVGSTFFGDIHHCVCVMYNKQD
jgi:hypothetical protein